MDGATSEPKIAVSVVYAVWPDWKRFPVVRPAGSALGGAMLLSTDGIYDVVPYVEKN